MAKRTRTIKELKAMATRGVGFSNKAIIELSPEDLAAVEVASAQQDKSDDKQVEIENHAENTSAEIEEPGQIVQSTTSLSKEAIQSLISQAIITSNQAHKQEINEIKSIHAQQLKEVQSSSDEREAAAKDEATALQNIISGLGLDKLKGEPQPVVNDASGAPQPMTVLGAGSSESRAFKQMVDSLQGVVVVAKRGGQVCQRDTRQIDEYYRKNKDAIASGLEAQMKEAGLLKGTAVTNAITSVSDIPSLSFEYLSAAIRNTHFPDLIHSQFATYELELGTRPGLVIAVPRHNDIARPTSFADRVISPGTRLDTTGRAQEELNVLVTLQELGLGKDAANTVIGLSTFITSYSVNNLEQIVVNKLGRDFMFTKDMGLYEQWFGTDRIVYNSNDTVTTIPTNVDTGDNGTMTQKFLIKLRSYLKSNEVPTFDDGCYGIAMNPTAIGQYMITKSDKERDQAMRGNDLVGQMLASSTGSPYGGETPGYRGKYDGFHIFEHNAYGLETGVDGDAGTNLVTLGTGPGATLVDTSFAFGPRTITWAEGLPAEIRMTNDDDFQREKLMTWYSHATPGSINVKNTPATGEQMRVVEIRTARAVL